MKDLKIESFRMFMKYENIPKLFILSSIFLIILLSIFVSSPLVSSQSAPQIHWSNESLISSSNNSTLLSMDPSITTDSQGNVHIIWMQRVSRHIGEVFYSKLDKFGNIVISNRQLTNFSGVSGFRSSISVDKWDNVHMIYDYDKTGTSLHGAMYLRLDHSGNIVVNGTLLPRNTISSELAVDGQGNLHIANGFIYQKFDNLGNALIPEISLANITQWNPLEPEIVVDSNDNAHIVWMEESTQSSNPTTHIKYSKIDSSGNIVVHNLQLDTGLNYSQTPSIAIDKQDNIYISWFSSNGSVNSNYLSKINKNGTFSIDRKPFTSESVGDGVIGVDPLGNINFIGRGQGFIQLNSTGDLIIGPFVMAIPIGSSAPEMTVDRQGALHFVWHVVDNEIGRYQIDYRRSLNSATLRVIGVPKPGSQIQFVLQDIYNVNGNYTFGFSGGISPGLNLSDGRKVPLKDDDFLRASLYTPQAIGLIGSTGILNQYSQATVTFNIPNIPLSGTKLYGGFVTQDSTGKIISISDPVAFTIL